MIPSPVASERAIPRPVSARFWSRMYDLTARHQWVGVAAGIVLTGTLVPILILAGGYPGPLSPAIPLFFLVPVLVASTLGGRLSGVVVAIASVAAWDWFFIPPFYLPTISSPRDLLALVVFLCVALLTGQLASVARHRADDAVRRARTSEALYDLSAALIGSHDPAVTLPFLARRLCETFDLRACAILLRGAAGRPWSSAAASGAMPDDLDIEKSRSVAGVLSWIDRTGQVCTLDHAQFWPLHVGSRLVGVLELVYKRGAVLDTQRDRLLATLVNGVAIALEQDRLLHEEQEAAVARESDRLKTALLSSVSHDLRTPLAGIKAASSSLLQGDVAWSEEDRRSFLTDIDNEADRLARLVANLLDLSRIEAGAIRPKLEWEDIGELTERVAARLRPRHPQHPIQVQVGPGLPPVRIDTIHLEQVLTNLVENAARYSPEGMSVVLEAWVARSTSGPGELHISVTDNGSGIEPDEQDRIFEPFYRTAEPGLGAGGTGMGLAIVKGLIEANGGHIMLQSERDRGSRFTVVLPVDGAIERAIDPGQDTAHAAQELPAR